MIPFLGYIDRKLNAGTAFEIPSAIKLQTIQMPKTTAKYLPMDFEWNILERPMLVIARPQMPITSSLYKSIPVKVALSASMNAPTLVPMRNFLIKREASTIRTIPMTEM